MSFSLFVSEFVYRTGWFDAEVVLSSFITLLFAGYPRKISSGVHAREAIADNTAIIFCPLFHTKTRRIWEV